MNDTYLGIDLGGSNISAALMSSEGKLLCLEKIETQARQGPAAVIRRLIELARSLQSGEKTSGFKIRAMGIGVPGILCLENGLVRFSPNLPGWKNIQLLKPLQDELKIPVIMDNDANVAAFGEKWQGAGRKYQHMVMFTLGTGVGGGIIFKGHILHGHCDAAGELGHITVLPDGPRCACGNRGCLEAMSSGTAIAREGQALLKNGHRGVLERLSRQNGGVTAKLVFQAARQGDAKAHRIVEKAGQYLGIGIANVINLLNPEAVVLGGGVASAGEILLSPVRREVRKRALKELSACTKIHAAKLGERAGVFGAVGIAVQAFAPVRRGPERRSWGRT